MEARGEEVRERTNKWGGNGVTRLMCVGGFFTNSKTGEIKPLRGGFVQGVP